MVYLPLWKIWKSVGTINPNIWKNKIHVPNHQAVMCLHYVGRIWASLRCTQQIRPCWRYTFAGSAPTVLFWVIMSLYVISFPRVFLHDVLIGSMYAIYDDIYHQYTPNISIYTIHGSYRVCDFIRLLPVEIHVLTVRNQEAPVLSAHQANQCMGSVVTRSKLRWAPCHLWNWMILKIMDYFG